MKIHVSARIYLITFISSILQSLVAGFCGFAFLSVLPGFHESASESIIPSEAVAVISFIAVWIGFICVIQLLRRRIPPTRRNAAGIGAIVGVISEIGYCIWLGGIPWKQLTVLDLLWSLPVLLVGAAAGVPFGIFNYWF
jgi:hypothetical protein